MKSILDPSFKWTPSASTNVSATWKKHGFKPTTDAERRSRQQRKSKPAHGQSNVRKLRSA